jgi:regulatory protein
MGRETFRQRKGKRIKIPTPTYLANVALYYLSRFAASEASLRRVLENRVRRAAMANPEFAADAAARETAQKAIDAIVAQHVKSGVVNDSAFAEMKVRGLRRAGRSQRRITQQLQHKGIAADVIARALQPEDDRNPEDIEKQSALAFARRRKLGPFRKEEASKETKALFDQRRKDLASMARAGFSCDIARQVLGGDVEEEY